MELKKVWTEEVQVKSTETDFRLGWKISSFFTAAQEAAQRHAEHLGFGFQELWKQDMIWILSRVKFQIYSIPMHEEKVTIQTWPKTIQQRVFFVRDHLMYGSDGRKCAAASSAYILVNPKIRRMLPAQALPHEIPDNSHLKSIDETLEKITPVDALQDCFEVQARYSSVDLAGHVNNARYVDWVSDCFSFQEHQTRRLSWIQLNFNNEVLPGETMRLSRGQYAETPDRWYVTGENLQTGKRAFDAILEWLPEGK